MSDFLIFYLPFISKAFFRKNNLLIANIILPELFISLIYRNQHYLHNKWSFYSNTNMHIMMWLPQWVTKSCVLGSMCSIVAFRHFCFGRWGEGGIGRELIVSGIKDKELKDTKKLVLCMKTD